MTTRFIVYPQQGWRSIALALWLGSLAACTSSTSKSDSQIRASAPAPAAGAAWKFLAPYPRGRWRFASSEELGSTMLWAAHVIIRHRDVKDWSAPLSWGLWTRPEHPGEQRSRSEALELAQKVHDSAVANPSRFRALAAEFSDDLSTKDLGGDLGGIDAGQLSRWPQLLDAFAVLQPEQVSEVIESELGFHVLLRHPPPPDVLLSGRRLVIGYAGADWLQVEARGSREPRTRQTALGLAAALLDQVKLNPAVFPQLIERYSENVDADSGGDLGVWSSRSPTVHRRETIALSGAEIGATPRLIDSPLGIQLVQRWAPTERESFTAERLRFSFDSQSPPEASNSSSSMRKLAEAALHAVRLSPSEFGSFQRRSCCAGVLHWTRGLGPRPMAGLIEPLQVGQVYPVVVEAPGSFDVVRRVPDDQYHPHPITFELPQPVVIDFSKLVAKNSGPILAEFLRRYWAEAASGLAIPDARRADLEGVHLDAIERFGTASTSEQKEEVLAMVLGRLQAMLDTADFQRYQQGLRTTIERVVLSAP